MAALGMKSADLIAGKYRLDKRLGVGGMGEVWRATHTGTGREVAVKFMHAHVAASEAARERFEREAKASAKIRHASMVDVFDVGELDDGILYLVMELLDGVLLVDALSGSPPLSVHDLLAVMVDIAGALAAAHAAGVIHRDIKPENIFLHKELSSGMTIPKLLDFGIGKFSGAGGGSKTATGAILGSPRYMSPEQTRSAAGVDARADLWACGVILFEALTGTWPHEGDSFSSLVVAICTTPPMSIDKMVPDMPEAVRAIVRDCLKPLEQRMPSADELARRLTLALEDPSLTQIPLAQPLQPAGGPAQSTSGLRFRASASLMMSRGAAGAPSSPAASRLSQMGPPSAVVPGGAPPEPRGSSPGGPLFKPVAKTMPLPSAADVQAMLDAHREKKPASAERPPTADFTPQAQTSKIDPKLMASVRAAVAAAGPPAPSPSSPGGPPSSGRQMDTFSGGPPSTAAVVSPKDMFGPASLAAMSAPVSTPAPQQPPRPPPIGPQITLPSQQPQQPQQPQPLPQELAAPPARSSRGLGVLAAILAVALTGIVIALVSTLRSEAPAKPAPSSAASH
jgi:eukaryotic-like serine/threonine-protein kinase